MKKIIVVGAGLAGLTSAIKISESNNKAILVSPSYSEHAQSVMAMGGINVALNTKGQNDSIKEHFNDTIKGGNYINDYVAVNKLVSDAPRIIKWLSDIGTSFTRDDNGNIDLRYFGGQKKMRTAYAGARTGKQILTALVANARKKEYDGLIERRVGLRLLSLIITDNNECIGAIFINELSNQLEVIEGDAVILATGGMNKIFGKISGSIQNDGYATAISLIQGVELANLEMIQYHPTTINTPVKKMLITEAARGEGGRLYAKTKGNKWYFMEEWYPEFGALMPRDVVSRSIYQVCNNPSYDVEDDFVYLDITHLDSNIIKTKLDEVYDVCTTYLKLDPTINPIPISPGIHYFMGGIKTDENHKTNIKGLYACGECSCQYHGANRLGGNSLLGAIHGGWVCAEEVIKDNNLDISIKQRNKIITDKFDIENFRLKKFINNHKSNFSFSCYEIEDMLSDVMNNAMGIYRDENTLNQSLIKLEELCTKLDDVDYNNNYYHYFRLKNLIVLSKAIILCALNREESRGSHQRVDFPETNDELFLKTTCVNYEKNKINVYFRDINH